MGEVGRRGGGGRWRNLWGMQRAERRSRCGEDKEGRLGEVGQGLMDGLMGQGLIDVPISTAIINEYRNFLGSTSPMQSSLPLHTLAAPAT